MTLIAKDMAFQPQLKCLIFLETEPKVYFTQGRVEISRMSYYSYAGLTLLVEVRVPVLLKVKAYTRVRFGKTENVSSYYRRIGVRK